MIGLIIGLLSGIALTVLFPSVFNWGRSVIDKITGTDTGSPPR